MRLSYRWEDLVAIGSFGKIFAAKITSTPVHNDGAPENVEVETDVVAMKKARVTNHIRHPLLLHEASVLTLLQGHPNIHRVFAWGRSQYFEYIAMELLGPNVEDVVSSAGLSQRNAVALACQMLDAIEFVHGEGIVHGDVKPANICLGRGDNAGRLYLIDFGFAWRFTTDSPAIGQRGTVPFCSMRVLKGETALPRDDLESLAYTVARLLTGSLPWAFLTYRDRCDRGAVRGKELFEGHPDVFAEFTDFALGLSPTSDLQYARWRDAFRALEPDLPEHQCPMFDQQDTVGDDDRHWVDWMEPSPTPKDEVIVPVPGGPLWFGPRDYDDIFGGPGSRSPTGGDHGYNELWGSEWMLLPCGIESCHTIGDEFGVVAGHLDFVDEPPLYNGGRSTDDTSPLEVMNNAQSDTHRVHPP